MQIYVRIFEGIDIVTLDVQAADSIDIVKKKLFDLPFTFECISSK